MATLTNGCPRRLGYAIAPGLRSEAADASLVHTVHRRLRAARRAGYTRLQSVGPIPRKSRAQNAAEDSIRGWIGTRL